MSYKTYPIRVVGGRLALNFLNTADWSVDGDVIGEKLVSEMDVALWCDAVGLSANLAARSSDIALELRNFRAALRPAFDTALQDSGTWAKAMNRVNEALASVAPDFLRQRPSGEFGFSRKATIQQLVAISAVSVLADPLERDRLKMCEGDRCGWFFVDESRNGRRRWCSMETCGNRAKTRRHYARKTRPDHSQA